MIGPEFPANATPVAPVRDESKLGPTEDLDRQPDGVPHSVVGLTALFAVMLAGLVAIIFATGSGMSRFGGLVIVLIAVPVLIGSLRNRSERDRSHAHPSR